MPILLAENVNGTSSELAAVLAASGFQVEMESDSAALQTKGASDDIEAVILDLAASGMDGLAPLKHWRAGGRALPVLVLSASGTWNERVAAIEAGADDYLPRPFRPEEAIARLRSILRRSVGAKAPVLVSGPLMLDPRSQRVTRSGMALGLTPQEYRLLNYLMHHAGRIVTRAELMEQLYAGTDGRDINAIEVLIGRVRRKVGAGAIETRRGLGYIVNHGPARAAE